MKKAKIMLFILPLIATIAGALAFKVKKTHIVTYFICNTTSQQCKVTITSGLDGSITTIPAPGLQVLTTLGGMTTMEGEGCAAQNCTTTLFYDPNGH